MSNESTKVHPQLQRILASAQLPALPQSAIRVLELSRDPNNGPPEFAVPIEADPGLTLQVRKFVNSSYFGFSREVSSVRLGITLIGIRTIKNFVLWNAVFSLMPNPKCGPFDLKLMWQDSLRRGLFARAMGKLLRLKETEDLFATALLQDMAVPLLAKALPTEYAMLLTRREEGRVRLSTLEQTHFGWNHAEASAHLAAQWNLPVEFARYLREHTAELPNAIDSAFAVALSSMLPSCCDARWHEASAFEAGYRRACPVGGPELGEFLTQVDREFAEFAPVLKLPDAGNWLADRYHESAQPA